jgi:hypothetical protein
MGSIPKYICILLFVAVLFLPKWARALTMQEIINGQTGQGQVLGATTNGLVGYWNFDEGSGTVAADSSGNGNNGTITGATWTAGKVGSGALSFNGTNNYVNAGSNSSLDDIQNQGGGGMTVAFWINPASNATNYILSKGSHANLSGTWEIAKSSATNPARLAFFKEGNPDLSVSWNSILTTGVWQHIALTWDGTMAMSGVFIYRNGLLVTSPHGGTDGAVGNSDAANNLSIGSSNGASGYLDAGLDEVRIYNRVLSAQEVLDVYNDTGSGTPPPPPSGDTTAPSVPAGLTATAISSSQINLSWTASTDNVGVAGYKIYRNGAQLTTATNTTFSGTSLSPSTTYSYAVSAYDTAGNNSVQSASVNATTQIASTNNVELHNSFGSVINTYTTIQACANVVIAGQTCLVNSGTYNERVNVINPGTQNGIVTFKASGSVIMTGFDVTNKPYIVIDGFEITNTVSGQSGIYFNGSPGSKAMNNYIHDTTGFYGIGITIASSSNVEIIGNTISRTGGIGIRMSAPSPWAGSSDGVLIKGNTISYSGYPDSPTDEIQTSGTNVLVENNDMSHAGDFVNPGGSYQVIRNNTFHDVLVSDWTTSPHIDGVQGYGNHILVEGNREFNCSEAGANCHFVLFGNDQNKGFADATVRYNTVNGIDSAFSIVQYGFDGARFYNNTVVKTNRSSITNKSYSANAFTSSSIDGAILNNIFFDAVGGADILYYVSSDSFPGLRIDYNLAWGTACGTGCTWNHTYPVPAETDLHGLYNVNPLFYSYVDDTNYGDDFHLQSSSPAIDKGGPLTRVSSSDSGSGTTLAVDDAGFFQDGWAGVDADWIAVGSTGNVAQIASINYATNVITLASPITRSAGAPIYLYKNSSGQQVLYGSAPDIGAYEYSGSTPPPSDVIPPSAPTGVAVN